MASDLQDSPQCVTLLLACQVCEKSFDNPQISQTVLLWSILYLPVVRSRLRFHQGCIIRLRIRLPPMVSNHPPPGALSQHMQTTRLARAWIFKDFRSARLCQRSMFSGSNTSDLSNTLIYTRPTRRDRGLRNYSPCCGMIWDRKRFSRVCTTLSDYTKAARGKINSRSCKIREPLPTTLAAGYMASNILLM